MKIGQRATPTGVLAATASTPEDRWLELRREGVGGSDVAGILNLTKWSSPWQVYLEKTAQTPPMERGDRLERAAMWGHMHEETLARIFCQETGYKVSKVGLLRHADEPWRQANLDRRVHGCPDGPCFLEEKTRSAYRAGEWGPSGDPDGVPDAEALQTYHYMAVTGYRHGHVAVLLGGNDDRYYRLDWDESLIADVVAIERRFWFGHVQAGVAPPVTGTDTDSDLLAAMWAAEPGSTVELGEAGRAARDRIATSQARAKAAAADLDQAKNEARALLGDYETGLADGTPVLTWKRNGPIAEKRFREDHPVLAARATRLAERLDTTTLNEIAPETVRPYRSRVLRLAGTRGN